jgi:putative membrane protein
MRMKFRITVLAAAVFGPAATTILAQPSTLSNADKQFLVLAAKASMTEAHLGQMAESAAPDASLKSFGQTLVQDHTKAYEELSVLSTKTGQSIPKESTLQRTALFSNSPN